MPDERQILLTVEDRVYAYLTKLATAAGRQPGRYAQELFEAAYAARCGFGQGDQALETEVAKIERRPAAIAAPAAAERPAIAASARREIDNAIPAQSEEFGRLSRALATARALATKVPLLERTIASLRAELDQAAGRLAAAEAAKPKHDGGTVAALEEDARRLTRDRENLQQSVGRLTREVEALTARADAAEAALAAAAPTEPATSAQPPDLAAAIGELKQIGAAFRDVLDDQTLQRDQLDQLFRRMHDAVDAAQRPSTAPAPVIPAAPAPTPRPPRPPRTSPNEVSRAPKTVWDPKWGRR